MDETTSLHLLHREGPRPVLLIHGFGSTAELTWDASGWLRAIASEGRGYIAPDLPGHGASTRPLEPNAYTIDALIAVLVDLLDRLTLPTVDVIGYSLGAQLARGLAVTHPTRVRRLVLGGIGESELFASWDLDAIGQFLRGEANDAGDATKILLAALSLPGASADSLAALIEGLSRGVIDCSVPQPSILVVGGQDKVASDAPKLATRIGAKLHVLPGRTHWNAVSARTFKQIALGFLRVH